MYSASMVGSCLCKPKLVKRLRNGNFGGHPSRLWTDKGTEFYNQQLKAVLAANNDALLHRERREIEHCGTVEQNDEEYNVEVLYSE